MSVTAFDVDVTFTVWDANYTDGDDATHHLRLWGASEEEIRRATRERYGPDAKIVLRPRDFGRWDIYGATNRASFALGVLLRLGLAEDPVERERTAHEVESAAALLADIGR